MALFGDSEREQSLTVLLVDDDSHDREVYKRALSRNFPNVNIQESDTMRKGLAFLHDGGVDCVLLDNNLPDGSGVDFLAAARREKLAPDAAVIMVTGAGDEQTAVSAMKLGARDYLVKTRGMEDAIAKSVLQAIERARYQQEIAAFRDRLEASHRALSEFAHTASHDLKAPLRRIMSYCDMLTETAAERLTPEEKGYIDRLGVNARRMRQLVDDLMVFARTGHAERERLQKTDMRKVAEEAIEVLGEAMTEAGAQVHIDALPEVDVYPVRMRQMFQNLIGNALKYHSAAPPDITLSCVAGMDEYIFSVRDNGVGIDPKYQERIFRAFERLHAHDDIEGSGLGLSICKKVADMHGGRLWVESMPGQGATFFFSIPRRDSGAGNASVRVN